MAEIIYPFKKYNYKVLIDQSEEEIGRASCRERV